MGGVLHLIDIERYVLTYNMKHLRDKLKQKPITQNAYAHFFVYIIQISNPTFMKHFEFKFDRCKIPFI